METIRLGDILLFSNNTANAFLIKTTTSSIWNHVGIAIRYKITDQGKLIFCDDGELCVLETNACSRYDPITKRTVPGVGFSTISYVTKKYNRIDVRRVNQKCRPDDYHQKLRKFVDKYYQVKFPDKVMPFISVWLGTELTTRDRQQVFCSELVSQYILECLQIKSTDLSEIFDNDKLPRLANLYQPSHYDIQYNNYNEILLEQQTVYTAQADLTYVIIQPLLLGLMFFLVLILSLF